MPAASARLSPSWRTSRTGRLAHKITFDACREPGFLDRLEDRRDIVVAGCEAHVCVLQTALGLLDAGERVYLVRDAVGSRRSESKETAIARMARHGAEIVTTEMVIFEWLGCGRASRGFSDAVALITWSRWTPGSGKRQRSGPRLRDRAAGPSRREVAQPAHAGGRLLVEARALRLPGRGAYRQRQHAHRAAASRLAAIPRYRRPARSGSASLTALPLTVTAPAAQSRAAERAGFDETREPQPLIEASLGAFGAPGRQGQSTWLRAQANRSSLSLANGLPFARTAAPARPAPLLRQARGAPCR